MVRQSARQLIEDPRRFDVLSGAWILASNDENSIMTYKSVKYRLGLSEDYPLKELIKSRGELFRIGIPDWRLNKWKTQMVEGKHLPSWVRELEDEKHRNESIRSLSSEDVFRSQFRAEPAADRSLVDTLDWGLNHIDRLRRASLESKAQSAKSWQMWLVFGTSVAGIAVTLLF